MRIPTFGDIHGNLFALQAALTDLRTQRPDGLLVTGDLVYKFPWGAEVVDLLRSVPCQVILGNSELYLALLTLRGHYPVAAFVANRLRPTGSAAVPDEGLDFVRYRWGDAPDWWEERDALPAWRALRSDGAVP